MGVRCFYSYFRLCLLFYEVSMIRGSVPSVQSGALHTFSRAPQANIPRSTFNRSHGCKTTFNEEH